MVADQHLVLVVKRLYCSEFSMVTDDTIASPIASKWDKHHAKDTFSPSVWLHRMDRGHGQARRDDGENHP